MSTTRVELILEKASLKIKYIPPVALLKENMDSRAKLKIPCKIVVGGVILVEGDTKQHMY